MRNGQVFVADPCYLTTIRAELLVRADVLSFRRPKFQTASLEPQMSGHRIKGKHMRQWSSDPIRMLRNGKLALLTAEATGFCAYGD
jgi:hypothetical protein